MHSEAAKPPGHQKVALVTGGSYGLGFAIAEQLGALGYRVVILARNEKRLGEAVAKLSSGPGSACGIPCDVADVEGLKAAFEQVRTHEGHLDYLVVNAGSVQVGLLEDLSPATALSDIETGLAGAVLTALVFHPLLREGARALFISSGFGLMGAAGYAPYCAAKAGIINFAEAVRREWLRRNISVSVACPSDIETPGYRGEMEARPLWMKQAGPRGKALDSRVAASRILAQCEKCRFLILINPELRMLQLAKRLLPERALRFLVDRLFPKPPP